MVWPEHGSVYSASWDHSIRRWDIETGKDIFNLVCEDALISSDIFNLVCEDNLLLVLNLLKTQNDLSSLNIESVYISMPGVSFLGFDD